MLGNQDVQRNEEAWSKEKAKVRRWPGGMKRPKASRLAGRIQESRRRSTNEGGQGKGETQAR